MMCSWTVLATDLLDLPAGGIVQKGVVRVRDILVGDQAAFVGDGFENESIGLLTVASVLRSTARSQPSS